MTSAEKTRRELANEASGWSTITAYLSAAGLLSLFVESTGAAAGVVFIVIIAGHFLQRREHSKRLAQAFAEDWRDRDENH